MFGKARMDMKVGLTYTCMNLKKLAGIMKMRDALKAEITLFLQQFFEILVYKRKAGLNY